jgi:hypothetical protein
VNSEVIQLKKPSDLYDDWTVIKIRPEKGHLEVHRTPRSVKDSVRLRVIPFILYGKWYADWECETLMTAHLLVLSLRPLVTANSCK